MLKIKKRKSGFTLVEIMVSLFVFSLVFGAVASILALGIRGQSRALGTQQLLSETSYVIEYMGRAIRMARKDDVGGIHCLSGEKVNYATTTSGIRFRNYNNECQEFYRECTGNVCRLKEKRRPPGGTETENYLTSPNLNVVSFNIASNGGWGQGDDYLQPRVTISLQIRRVGEGDQPEIRIQTTISQRELDVPQ